MHNLMQGMFLICRFLLQWRVFEALWSVLQRDLFIAFCLYSCISPWKSNIWSYEWWSVQLGKATELWNRFCEFIQNSLSACDVLHFSNILGCYWRIVLFCLIQGWRTYLLSRATLSVTAELAGRTTF